MKNLYNWANHTNEDYIKFFCPPFQVLAAFQSVLYPAGFWYLSGAIESAFLGFSLGLFITIIWVFVQCHPNFLSLEDKHQEGSVHYYGWVFWRFIAPAVPVILLVLISILALIKFMFGDPSWPLLSLP